MRWLGKYFMMDADRLGRILGLGWFITCMVVGTLLLKNLVTDIKQDDSKWDWLLEVYVFAWVGILFFGRFALSFVYRLFKKG